MSAIISHQEPEPQAPGPKPPGGHMNSSTLMGPPPVPPHNYANLPSGQQQGHAGARPRPSNPLYGKKEEVSNYPSYIEVDRREPESVYGPRGSYEAETLRSDSKMMLPPSYSLVAEQHGGDSGGQFKQFENQYGARPPVPQSPAGSRKLSLQPQYTRAPEPLEPVRQFKFGETKLRSPSPSRNTVSRNGTVERKVRQKGLFKQTLLLLSFVA